MAAYLIAGAQLAQCVTPRGRKQEQESKGKRKYEERKEKMKTLKKDQNQSKVKGAEKKKTTKRSRFSPGPDAVCAFSARSAKRKDRRADAAA